MGQARTGAKQITGVGAGIVVMAGWNSQTLTLLNLSDPIFLILKHG